MPVMIVIMARVIGATQSPISRMTGTVGPHKVDADHKKRFRFFRVCIGAQALVFLRGNIYYLGGSPEPKPPSTT